MQGSWGGSDAPGPHLQPPGLPRRWQATSGQRPASTGVKCWLPLIYAVVVLGGGVVLLRWSVQALTAAQPVATPSQPVGSRGFSGLDNELLGESDYTEEWKARLAAQDREEEAALAFADAAATARDASEGADDAYGGGARWEDPNLGA